MNIAVIEVRPKQQDVRSATARDTQRLLVVTHVLSGELRYAIAELRAPE